MPDADLAALYGVSAKRLNEQVSRNRERFPKDFMFTLTHAETQILKSQFATSRLWGRPLTGNIKHVFIRSIASLNRLW